MPKSLEKSLDRSLPITISTAITTQLIKISFAPRPSLSIVKFAEREEKTIAGKNTFVWSVARFVVALEFSFPLLPKIKPIKVKEVLYENGKRISEKEHIEYADEEIYIPPDTTAQIFWLKNRKPEEWRDKRQVEEKVEIESDGFLEALKSDTKSTFEKAGDFIET